MIKVEFKEPVKGSIEIICNGLSVDPMNEYIFLIQSRSFHIVETPLTNIKHISSYEDI
jgi:hypothetical protein